MSGRGSSVVIQQEQRPTVVQRIDPKIIQANSVLQLNSIELLQFIEDELLDNPALETLEESCDGICLDSELCPFCKPEHTKETVLYAESTDSGDHEIEYDSYGAAGQIVEDDYDIVSNMEAETTLQDHLLGLLRTAVSSDEYPIGAYIVNSLDDRGWLDESLHSIARYLGVEELKVEQMLAVIQSFDPPGIGARSLQECLLLQLCQLRDLTPEQNPTLSLAEALVRDHFEFVTINRYTRLARAVKVPLSNIMEAITLIRTRLTPSPASQFRPQWSSVRDTKSSVRADVIVRRTELGYEIEVPSVEAHMLSVSAQWRETYKQIKSGAGRHTEEQKRQVVEYVDRAERFIQNIIQRRQTLRLITKCIVECQTGFLETGSHRFLRPLTRTRVARLLDIHESTASRATANKYVQLPNQEVVSFDLFFDASLSIKNAICDIVANEDPSDPLSDTQIVDALKERGIEVARRTVVKYREQQKILSSSHRRR